MDDEVSPLRITPPYSMVVSGASNSGKTFFIIEFLKNLHRFQDVPFSKIYWCYGVWNDVYESMLDDIPFLHFVKGFPVEQIEQLENASPAEIKEMPHTLYVLDDLMLSDNKSLSKLAAMFVKLR